MKLIESKTYLNLAKSYAGESQAYIRYKFIEYCARNEGYKTMAEMIDNIVYNEFNHARMFYTKLQDASDKPIENINISTGYPFKEKWNLLDNLKLAAEDELLEANKIYPEYAKIAKQEGFDDIAELWTNIIQVETCHNKLLTQLYDQLKNKTLYKKPQRTKWKCADCGYEKIAKEAWTECPICLAKQGSVMLKIESE